MEFHESAILYRDKVYRFNSQRDGILPRGAQQPLASLSEVSIPNGMEFYQGLWRVFYLCIQLVSIPNGMEFYRSSAPIYLCVFSFNSQRDRILRMQADIRKNAAKTRFNSQRDRILRKYKTIEKHYRKLFQFPTGWNSTNPIRLGRRIFTRFNSQRDGILHGVEHPLASLSEVSIPNGMEFYQGTSRILRGDEARFNSQRDGILLFTPLINHVA